MKNKKKNAVKETTSIEDLEKLSIEQLKTILKEKQKEETRQVSPNDIYNLISEKEQEELQSKFDLAIKNKDIIKYINLLEDSDDRFAGDHLVGIGFFKKLLKTGAKINEILDNESVEISVTDENKTDVFLLILEQASTFTTFTFNKKKNIIYISWS
jgi:hypothetical protein